MAIEFDPINKWIKITSGTSISALTIYNAVMDWVDVQENMGYSIPMKAVGKFPMGGGVNSDSIFILTNGWKIKLYDGNYQFIITGTLITDDESPRTVPPDSGNVEMVFQTSSQGTVVVSGSGVTQQDKDDIAGLINPNVIEIQGQCEEIEGQVTNIEQHHAFRRKIEGDYLIYYDGDQPILKYKLIKDDEGRIIERIPEPI